MQRRSLLAAAGAALLAKPSLAQGVRPRTLRFVPQANLTVLDPILTTAGVSLNHGYAVFDTLYGTGADFKPVPQMAEGHEVSADGRTWLIRLRPGLRFHDGEPVRAVDCAASLARWSKRDTFGQTLGAAVEAWEAQDDRTLRIRLSRPFPRLLSALAFVGPIPAFIMPERLAKTDPYKAVTEMVGSGPYRFLPDEFVSGSRVAYAKSDGYVPRQEPAVLNAGGKVAHFDRLEWQIIPDSSTAASALQSGEVDWWEFADADLTPMLSRNRGITVASYDPLGFMAFLRFNSHVPPFNNAKLKRVVLSAVDQAQYMPLITGGDDKAWHTAYSMFPTGLPFVKEVGAEAMGAPKDLERLRRAVKDAGYAGEKVVILSPTDLPTVASFGDVTAELLKQLGMNVDLQVMDWGSVVQRRTSREPVEKGGWSIFHTTWKSSSIANPALNTNIRGQGDSGWFGWFRSEGIERLTREWLDAASDAEQQRLFDAIQLEAFEQVPVVPLGQFLQKTAYRSDLTGMLPGPAAFPWNLRRA
ncbi:ABC transporter substrate-binding protein [Pseudoroseomonas wenyumeiae]|uniref:ABC transporter substrate-binding protein n=1 Tax=Teichococcus wenyumeiae TaxID=2478470 RepID=A0A3A9JS55_9PROT|nr:ABC transporter substrate-binding protein [Pseudoroseomonas wenyumeiae]RKK03518.1 ABC transporter substrate-binding protein [Pseudoroseomonas wenyumeiae]RMI16977.1 ABC transporter substrate-binding protein [Pseudoroseomonas wenyumeiae]